MNEDITVELTTDESYIKSVFLSPVIYSQMSDDSCPQEPSALTGVNIMAIPGFFLRALIGNKPVGVFWLIWRGTSLEAHTALMPECRGRNAIAAVKIAIQWVFDNTECSHITSYAWSDMPAVKWFCRAVGMQELDTKPWPAMRNGHSVDITYYSIQREGTT